MRRCEVELCRWTGVAGGGDWGTVRWSDEGKGGWKWVTVRVWVGGVEGNWVTEGKNEVE